MSAPKVATQVFLKTCPSGFIQTKVNEDDSTFEIKEVPIPELKEGQVLAKVLYLSNDPTQRTWLRKAGDNSPSYLPPVHEGTPMASLGLAEIVESKSDKYQKVTLPVVEFTGPIMLLFQMLFSSTKLTRVWDCLWNSICLF